MNQKETVVISLGGSIIVPDAIDIDFLKKFKKLIVKFVKQGKRFVIVTGGGKVARNYQNAARAVGSLNRDDLDWLGIHATRLNAHLLRAIFRDYAFPNVNKNPKKIKKIKESILIASGWKPGWSTDYDAVLLAKGYGAKTIINLSNISHVYNGDPSKDKNAKPMTSLTWQDYRKIAGNEWNPGANTPFDPIASKMAQKWGFKVIVAKGTDLPNLENILNGKKIKGTIINN